MHKGEQSSVVASEQAFHCWRYVQNVTRTRLARPWQQQTKDSQKYLPWSYANIGVVSDAREAPADARPQGLALCGRGMVMMKLRACK